MVKNFLITILLLNLFCSITFSQNITILASVDSSDYLIGDYINYNIEIRSTSDLQIKTPDLTDSLKNLELLKINNPARFKQDDKNITQFSYILSCYDSVEVTIPAISIYYKSKTDSVYKISFTNPVTFTVHTVPVKHQEDIKDVKEPITIPYDWKFLLLIAFIILILLVLAVIFYRRYKKKKSLIPVKKKIIMIPAHVAALSQLDKLESEKLWQNGKVKEYHSRITEIIRDYFSKRFNLPALELTTTESIQLLKRVREAKNVVQITNEFLNNADLVKFAKFIPMDSINQEMMQQAKEIVRQTIPSGNKALTEVENNV